MILVTFGAFYAWEYRPQTLIDETVPIKEEYLRQLNVTVLLGNRNVAVTVQTYNIPVFVTLWWQSGTSASVYVQDEAVAVNSTWTRSVTLHDSGGRYQLIVNKNESFGEGLTTIHVRVTT